MSDLPGHGQWFSLCYNSPPAYGPISSLLKLIGKDVKYGYSVPIPLDSVKLIPGLQMASMNIMAQNTIN
jgi:hypothetical protein